MLIGLLLGVFSDTLAQSNANIAIEISNIKSDEGKLYVALYDQEGNWLNEMYTGAIGTIRNNKSSVVIENVPPGVYAISMFHDQNDNQKLDMNFMGIPKEPTACSNNAKGSFGPPKWEDAKFAVKSEPLNLQITF